MSRVELFKIAEELCGLYTPQEFIEIYDKIMMTPYNFMVMDTRRPLSERWTERFTIPIEVPSRLKNLALRRNAEEPSSP
jgi:hypothetical protein